MFIIVTGRAKQIMSLLRHTLKVYRNLLSISSIPPDGIEIRRWGYSTMY